MFIYSQLSYTNMKNKYPAYHINPVIYKRTPMDIYISTWFIFTMLFVSLLFIYYNYIIRFDCHANSPRQILTFRSADLIAGWFMRSPSALINHEIYRRRVASNIQNQHRWSRLVQMTREIIRSACVGVVKGLRAGVCRWGCALSHAFSTAREASFKLSKLSLSPAKKSIALRALAQRISRRARSGILLTD